MGLLYIYLYIYIYIIYLYIFLRPEEPFWPYLEKY